MTKTKTIKARTPSSLQAKVETAKADGWTVRGEVFRYGGEFCVLLVRS